MVISFTDLMNGDLGSLSDASENTCTTVTLFVNDPRSNERRDINIDWETASTICFDSHYSVSDVFSDDSSVDILDTDMTEFILNSVFFISLFKDLDSVEDEVTLDDVSDESNFGCCLNDF